YYIIYLLMIHCRPILSMRTMQHLVAFPVNLMQQTTETLHGLYLLPRIISAGGNLTLLFNATVTKSESGTNIVNVTSQYCDGTRHTKEDDATVNVREPGDMVVTKTVKNATSEWLDEVDALVGETVRFNISILYTGYIISPIL
ncbi:hypothetical protein MBGDC06_00666, partial [Thermoplasmatales archaeon SCGC AB-539-C06]